LYQRAIEVRTERREKVPSAWYDQMGELYERLGNVKSAIIAYESALQIDQSDQLAIERLQTLRELAP